MRHDLQEAMIIAKNKPVLDVQAMDLDIQNPTALRDSMAPIFNYSARVEQEVARDAATIEAFLPNLNPEHAAYVNEVWLPQELAHGEAHDELLRLIDYPLPTIDETVDPKVINAGKIANFSERLHRIFFMTYAARGAIHERTTAISYRQQIQMLKSMGETGLAKTMFSPILIQEAPHLEVYRHMARETWTEMPTWERWMARQLLARTFSPVGTGTPTEQNRPHFGEVAMLLAGEKSAEEVMEPVLKLSEELMRGGSDILPRSIMKSIQDCIDEARQ